MFLSPACILSLETTASRIRKVQFFCRAYRAENQTPMHSVSLDLAKGQHPASRTANSDIACAKHGRFQRVFQLAAFAIILLPSSCSVNESRACADGKFFQKRYLFIPDWMLEDCKIEV